MLVLTKELEMKQRYQLLNTPKNQYAIRDTKTGKIVEKGEGDGHKEMQAFLQDQSHPNY